MTQPRDPDRKALLAVVVLVLETTLRPGVHAWTTTTTTTTSTRSSSSSSWHPHPPSLHLRKLASVQQRASPDDSINNTINNDEEEEPLLSDVDARVLREMLQDEKLNLQDEQNMKKLLERGVQSREPVRRPPTADEEDEEENSTPYSSSVLKTLGNTKLWKALERKAGDLLESAKIFVANKVERDSKLLASLGIYAWDRVRKDVARALPATASSQQRKEETKPNLLSSESSFQNSVRADMSTPGDEIKAVSRELKEIFQSGGDSATVTGKSTGSGNDIGLRSVSSSKSGKDRFLKAYERQKVTKLQREKENLAQKGTRAASKLMDSAYQVRRDLQVEPNQPGYKTKAIRAGAVSASKILASGATQLLGGAKEVAKKALKSQDEAATLPAATSSAPAADSMSTQVPAIDTPATRQEEPPQAPAPVNTRIPWTSQPQSPVAPQPSQVSLQKEALQNRLTNEVTRLGARLESCIQNPDTTWLQPSLLPSDEDSVDSDDLEPVVRQMILVENTLETVDSSFSFESLLDTLRQAKRQVDLIVETAQTSGTSYSSNRNRIADYLGRQLIYGENYKEEELGLPTLLKLDLIEREYKLLVEQEELEVMRQQVASPQADTVAAPKESVSFSWSGEPPTVEKEEDEGVIFATRMSDYVESEASPTTINRNRQQATPDVVEVEFTPTASSAASPLRQQELEEQEFLRQVYAEIVSEEDDYGAKFEGAVRASDREEEGDENDAEPNPVAKFSLRVLDVLFLVVEKSFMALPSVVSAAGLAVVRIGKANSQGMGSVGWEPIESAKRGDRRY